MAGTVVASYLNDGTTSGSTTDMVKGSARAWVNFNGTGTVAIRASYNVSSITDSGTGDYTVNFTTAMVDINYSTLATGTNTGSSYGAYIIGNELARQRTVNSWSIASLAYNAGQDASFISVAILR